LLPSGDISVDGTAVAVVVDSALVDVTGGAVKLGVTEVGNGCVDVDSGAQAEIDITTRMSTII
jgi:hypothetical protein